MQLKYKEITVRTATVADAEQLCRWWNDGAVMAHAGFPNGLGTTTEVVAKQIEEKPTRHMILFEDKPIGEMNYSDVEAGICEIGIKICEPDKQNQGIGKIALSLFIEGLFNILNYEKILLDTNLNNKRAQHVYEQLGFQKVRERVDAWKDQLGIPQTMIDYEVTKDKFVSYL